MLFCAALLLMLIGAINYDLSLGHALVFLLAGVGLVGMVHTFRNLLALRLSPGRAEAVFAGDTAFFPIALENSHRQPRRALELSFGKHPSVSLDLPAGQRAVIEIPCPAPRRGRLDPGRITLSSRYPLGIFRAWSYPHPQLRCLVYPQPIDSPLPPPAAVAHHGQYHGQQGQEDFTGLRLRQPNDSPRHIAWKAVARDIESRPLLVKQFAGGAEPILWLDWSLLSEDHDMETRLSILAGWVISADRQRLRYGLRLPDREYSPDYGETHCHTCLEALALYAQAD
jgi:uncharacterized protein (DUF58 family)